jgi:hypothetical protein
MKTLLVALSGIIAAGKTALVARDGVLVSFNAAITVLAKGAELSTVVLLIVSAFFPAEREVRGRDNLDKVHVVVVGIVGLLVGTVQGVQVVVGPRVALSTKLLVDIIRELGTETQLVDGMGERVTALHRSVPVVLEVVDVHVSIAEAAARGDVEVSDNLVHAQVAVDAAALVPLLVQLLGVVLALALLDALALTESP